MDVLHQPLDRSWWSIDESYVSITRNGFSGSLLFIVPMYPEVL